MDHVRDESTATLKWSIEFKRPTSEDRLGDSPADDPRARLFEGSRLSSLARLGPDKDCSLSLVMPALAWSIAKLMSLARLSGC
jgi:hypothetical protein